MDIKAINSWWRKGMDKARDKAFSPPQGFRRDVFGPMTKETVKTLKTESETPTGRARARHHR